MFGSIGCFHFAPLQQSWSHLAADRWRWVQIWNRRTLLLVGLVNFKLKTFFFGHGLDVQVPVWFYHESIFVKSNLIGFFWIGKAYLIEIINGAEAHHCITHSTRKQEQFFCDQMIMKIIA